MNIRALSSIVALLACATVSAQECIFLFPDFTEADFSFRQGNDVTAEFNFDTKGQKLYFLQNGEVMEMTNTYRIDTVTVKNRKFLFHDGSFCERIKNEYGEIFINWHFRDSFVGKQGAMGLTTQGKVEVMNVPGLNSEYSYENIGKYEDGTDVWVVKNENTYFFTLDGAEYRFRSVRDLCKEFPGKATQIKSFAKANNNTIKNAREALAMIYYIYSL